jgi:putative flippase GtrA
MSAQPLRFLGVGVCGYGVNLVAFALLYGAGARYAFAAVLAYLGSNAFMYIGNRYFTFRLGHDGFWAAYGRYLLVGCLVAALAAGVLAALVEVAGLEPRFGQPLALVIVAPLAFAAFKRVSFRLR